MSRPADQSRHRLLAARYLDRSLPPRGDLTRSELNTSAHAAMRVFFGGVWGSGAWSRVGVWDAVGRWWCCCGLACQVYGL